MKPLKIAALAFAATGLIAGAALAQTSPTPDQVTLEAVTIHHAGGRHDQKLHEAAERPRANGHRMQPTTVHAGGRHDVRAHEAAMKAEARRTPADRAAGDSIR